MSLTLPQVKLAQQLLNASHGDVEQAKAALEHARGLAARQHPPAEPVSQLRPRGEIYVHVDHLAKHYKVGRSRVEAIKDISLDIGKGEFVAITGTSGSGKSTLLQLIGGLDKPDGGSIQVAGQDIGRLRDGALSRFRNRTIGFVFQFFYLQPYLNVERNVGVPAMFSRTPRADRTARSQELAGLVGLADRQAHLPRELSGGQMQRVAIARALQNNPGILLADEPTGNLDHANAVAIFDLFRKIRDQHGTTVVVVTHDMELANKADRVVSLRDGALA